MLPYQAEGSIVLASFALFSAALLILNRIPSEGKIRLPSDESDDDPVVDFFDVTSPEDLIDGYPIDEESFWIRVRLRKIFASMLLSFLVVVKTATLFLGTDSVADILQSCVSIYLLFLTLRSVRRKTVERHAEFVWHLTSLTFFAVVFMGFTMMLPVGDSSIANNDVLWYLDSASLSLYAAIFSIFLTTPRGPRLHYPPSAIYSKKTADAITNTDENNVTGVYDASIWSFLFFSYSTKVVMLGNTSASLEIGDLPILTADMRATTQYAAVRAWQAATRWRPKIGAGWALAYQLISVNKAALGALMLYSLVAGLAFYLPPFFMSRVLKYLEADEERSQIRWGLVWVVCLFSANFGLFTLTAQLWSLSTTTLQARVRTQLNTVLFAKTLVRKDVASTGEGGDSSAEFSSKAQVMTLMTTDVDRVSKFSRYLFTVIDVPIELTVGTVFLYHLLGVSAFFGLAAALILLPLNHYAGKAVQGAQQNLMKARDERVALINEVLGAIRMLKFMAWERSYEKRVMTIRERELKYQRLTYIIEALLSGLWDATPMIVTLVGFYHFTVVRGEQLTPSIAFTSIIVFNELKYALTAIPETFINLLQSIVSLRRIEKYLDAPEVTPVPSLESQSHVVAFQSCTVTWPRAASAGSASASASSTPRQKFVLIDLTLKFPPGELSLICGALGSGKTLLLLALLGEADVLSGQMMCPRSPPNSLASFAGVLASKEEWVVQGMTAYVPQTAWLRNASIKENILFNLPYDEARYQATLEACALNPDLDILEDGDESEIGEHGVNLSGGQRSRVCLARAVYSRASILLLDDVLSAVDAHTARHLYQRCLKGDLMRGRTVILVSHHVQLCVPGAAYIVTLDNGRVRFQGTQDAFKVSGVMGSLVQSTDTSTDQDKTEAAAVDTIDEGKSAGAEKVKKAPRKFFEEEKRAVGRVAWDVWMAYIGACGSRWYWVLFCSMFTVAALSPVMENGWLSYWSRGENDRDAVYYLGIYTAIISAGLVITTFRSFVLYYGSINASTILHKKLLEAILFAQIRFHDTVSRGRLLNRFGKDFEGIDSNLSENFGTAGVRFVATITTIVTVSFVGGPLFVMATVLIAAVYYQIAKIYGQTSRDMRRIDSVTRSPLYSMYSETIAGVAILRSFGASSKFLRDMMRNVDTNMAPGYWTYGVNRWLTIRMSGLSSVVMALIALSAVLNRNISAAVAGFVLAFANTLTYDLNIALRTFVSLEQAMVGLERVKEYSDLDREAAEFVEPRPGSSWPEHGGIECENLVIRYAPDLPDVLHNVTFRVNPGEKIGILGRTGSGKSTLALSFFRFVEATEGRILVDGIDIASRLTDLRSKLTIIPQDPTIISGTLRSTLDVFDEYQDADIFEALHRVHLIPADGSPVENSDAVNENVFRNLDSVISEGGENLSTGEKQLLCMARAILKRSRVLVMDEATASVDYATDELIGRTIRHEFKESTILTIAHRLRTVIDYDRILLLDQGRVVEFDRPAVLLADPASQFYGLCKASGSEEFAILERMAGV
ncbi:multidrug resistance-associated ABC transporter [Roridomyces roridus]|uniref:Multidrug resistance-associated ABC transporter n=1 Tax=Roridomyces roridus TaxID=1738132 RepID=A0AAD7FBP2_9AGAR|nr:multidrug resistance-associated ABC transporter [Roridomyces roridus]